MALLLMGLVLVSLLMLMDTNKKYVMNNKEKINLGKDFLTLLLLVVVTKGVVAQQTQLVVHLKNPNQLCLRCLKD
jgi:cell division protein FtsX